MTNPMAQSGRALLQETHYHQVNAVLRSCAQVQADLDKCRAAGFPQDQLELENKAAAEIANGIKKQFFPDLA
jgi:hypothetical protein